MELKKRLAFEIVLQFHDAKAAHDADVHFGKVVQNKELPDEIEEARISFISFNKLFYESGRLANKAFDENNPEEAEENVVLLGKDKLHISIPLLLEQMKLVKSRSEARRLLNQRAIELDGNTVLGKDVRIIDGSIIKVGKRRIRKIVNSD